MPTLALLFGALAAAGVSAAAPDPVHEWEVAPHTTGVLVRDHRTPLVEVRIEFPAGSWMPWFEEQHASEAFAIQPYDPDGELRKRSDEFAVGLYASTGARGSTLGFSCRKVDLDHALALVRDVLANRDFDRDELSHWRAGRRIEWQGSLKDPDFVLMQSTARLLFAEDDPRRRPHEIPQPLVTDPRRLATARDALIRLPGRVIGFAGDLTPDEAHAIARDLLPPATDDPPPGLEPRLFAIRPRTERPDLVTPTLPRLTQTYYAYARSSLAIVDPDYPASMIADHVLGGHFYSRLMTALRHEGGETYDAGVYEDAGLEPGSYALTTFTRTENAGKTEAKLRAVLAQFHAEGITEEERARAAGAVTGSRAFDRQSPGQILAEVLWERRHALPRGFRDRQALAAAALSLDEVNAFIRRFHDPAQFTMVRLSVKP